MSFDYHLSAKEQKKVESLVPLHQAKIHLAFKAEITVNKKVYKDSACALSEHMVIIAKKGLFGSSYSALEQIHLIDLISIRTIDENTTILTVPDNEVTIFSPVSLRFARCLVRNYYCISVMFPADKRAGFFPHNPSLFPPFDPHLSPSQMFQFAYNAFCSYYDTSYFHDATRFFHTMVMNGSGIADLNRLPLHEIECNFGDPLDLRPLFAAFANCPLIYGVTCANFSRPDIVRSAALVVLASPTLRLLSLSNCNCEGGLREISSAIIANKNLKISYWDLSGNPFEDLPALSLAFSHIPCPVFYLNLSGCGLSAKDTLGFIKAIHSNKNLWQLRYLDFGGANVDRECLEALSSHLSTIHSHSISALKFLDIGSIGCDCASLISALSQFPQPIETLKLAKASFSAASFTLFAQFLSHTNTLNDLDLSSTGLKPEQIVEVIQTIEGNRAIKTFKLRLNDLSLSGKKLAKVIPTFTSERWTYLSFENNGIDSSDLISLINALKSLKGLKGIAVGGNLKGSSSEEALSLLASLSLEEISIKGTDRKYVGNKLIPFIHQLQNNGKLRSLDISNNQIGDDGIDAVASLIEDNRGISEIYLDGSSPNRADTLTRLFDVICSKGAMLSSPFPIEDVYRMENSVPTAERSALFELLASKQREAQNQMEKNMAERGIASELTKLGIPELNELLDAVTINVHERLQGVKVGHHSGINKVFGLPLPHLREDEEEGEGVNAEGDATADSYDMPEAKKTVVEKKDDDDSSFRTLQFNSLLIRRGEVPKGKEIFQDEDEEDTKPSTFENP